MRQREEHPQRPQRVRRTSIHRGEPWRSGREAGREGSRSNDEACNVDRQREASLGRTMSCPDSD
ncbi:uncharacterized protein LACBIDRAFT_298716 [Laccaria bicolor S238N-H82]|uniref:Predicted protein n=1 Tax=Laccaria bicolor (strain S238N-H82 / ATCC MYA-4686) TaxID=486041 RepID=B0DDH0_LACBS|nr:uncharacterized protein LACBIDRAFT_298716 [Laccaria bicolor S238N-H82]EDR07475.1 predicted protein [Laccaria bicolor S238N-H82]|eukprot:XP_001881867.1 predicted protein [Laccaria bicolor S238N-H82]